MYLDKSYILAEIKDCLADEIISWCYDNIDNSYLYEEEPYYGIVHDVHVTLLSDISDKNTKNIQKTIEEESPFTCCLGQLKLFLTNSKFDVLYIPIINQEICNINKNLSNYIQYNKFYAEYVPHVTLCYLKKGFGESFLGNRYFCDKSFDVDELIYSGPDTKMIFRLGKKL